VLRHVDREVMHRSKKVVEGVERDEPMDSRRNLLNPEVTHPKEGTKANRPLGEKQGGIGSAGRGVSVRREKGAGRRGLYHKLRPSRAWDVAFQHISESGGLTTQGVTEDWHGREMSSERSNHVLVKIHNEHHVIAASFQQTFYSTTKTTSKKHDAGKPAWCHRWAVKVGEVAVGSVKMHRT